MTFLPAKSRGLICCQRFYQKAFSAHRCSNIEPKNFTFLSLCLLVLGLIGPLAAYEPEKSHKKPEPIYRLDLTRLIHADLGDSVQAREAWDTVHLAASVQGIVNRERPTLFIRFLAKTDDFWWNYLTKEKKWEPLTDRPVVELDSIETLLETFAPKLAGSVVYNAKPYATSNLASTIAGVEDRVCLRYDPSNSSLYSRVKRLESKLPFLKKELRLFHEDGSPIWSGDKNQPIPWTDPPLPSSGSAKCDAYLWALQRYLASGRCSNEELAFYIDAYWLTGPTKSSLATNTVSNHDFFIARRAFFFDLNVWEEEAAVDDPTQAPGTDLKTLRKILRTMHSNAGGKCFFIGGFTPWVWKYTSHPGAGSKHGGVDTEWKYSQVVSSYNGIIDADAAGESGMANASFYQHFKTSDHYPQAAKRPTLDNLKQQGYLDESGNVVLYHYLTFYMGDYDSAAWLNKHVPLWWADQARGTIPCSWAFDPILDRRAPHAMDYARTHATENDCFISGDCGIGYLNPGMLAAAQREPGLADGWDAWTALNQKYFKKYDLSITGFVIDGHSPGMGSEGLDRYATFSPDGLVGQKVPGGTLHNGMPIIHMQWDVYGSPKEGAQTILPHLKPLSDPQFMIFRTILKSPSWHKATMAQVKSAPQGEKVRWVDPFTFFLLYKESLKKRGVQKTKS